MKMRDILPAQLRKEEPRWMRADAALFDLVISGILTQAEKDKASARLIKRCAKEGIRLQYGFAKAKEAQS